MANDWQAKKWRLEINSARVLQASSLGREERKQSAPSAPSTRLHEASLSSQSDFLSVSTHTVLQRLRSQISLKNYTRREKKTFFLRTSKPSFQLFCFSSLNFCWDIKKKTITLDHFADVFRYRFCSEIACCRPSKDEFFGFI